MVTYNATATNWKGLIDAAKVQGYSKFFISDAGGGARTSFAALPPWFDEMAAYIGSFNHQHSPTEVSLSNTMLPLDTEGKPLLTGEVSLLNNLERDGFIYMYMTNWGCCEQADCCEPGGLPWPQDLCYECCPAQKASKCTYADNHTMTAYRTKSFAQWEHLPDVVGSGLPSRNPGTAFIPIVLYSPHTEKYVLWYENYNETAEFWRCCGADPIGCCKGLYSVATSDSPASTSFFLRLNSVEPVQTWTRAVLFTLVGRVSEISHLLGQPTY
jgi:hypothetical protein